MRRDQKERGKEEERRRIMREEEMKIERIVRSRVTEWENNIRSTMKKEMKI